MARTKADIHINRQVKQCGGSNVWYDEDDNGEVDYIDSEGMAPESVVNQFINNSPYEFHLPKHSFTGPGTKVKQRIAELQEYLNGQLDEQDCEFDRCSVPYNRVDQAAMFHDMTYSKYKDLPTRWEADQKLLKQAEKIAKSPQGFREMLDALMVSAIMRTKLAMKA